MGSPLARRRLALHPALRTTSLDLALPDRCLRLDPVDRLAGAGEGFLAMAGGDGDDDAGLAQWHGAGAVLGGGGEEAVAVGGGGEDLRDPRLGHLSVGLVARAARPRE